MKEKLMKEKLIIAEVKVKNPYGFVSSLSAIKQLKLCCKVGDVISIHTNELWGGSWEWLEKACNLTNRPILAKGFHCTKADVQRAFDCGATYVLTVGWWNGDKNCWHECESLAELKETTAPKTIWNSLDPRTGGRRIESISAARAVRKGWLCQASLIRSWDDIHPTVQAVLIGESLSS